MTNVFLYLIVLLLAATTASANTLVIGTLGNSGGGGGSQSTTIDNDDIWAAKGDIACGTGADASTVLTVGTNDFTLLADSSATCGLRWAALPGGGDALVANTIGQFAAITSANLDLEITDDTGTGVAVFNNAPTFIAPVLGAATATSINGNAFPADDSTLVSVDDTQILTNKTINGASNNLEFTFFGDVTNPGNGYALQIEDNAVGGAQIELTSQATGSLMYANASGNWVPLVIGSVGQVLTVNPGGTLPEWSNATATGDNVLVDSANTSNPDFVSTGDIDFVNTGNSITANVQANTVALGTDTTGNYAGSSSEGGAATTATALAANGADCTAGNAPLGVDASGAAASCFDVVTQVEGDALAPLADPDFTGSLELPNGAPTLANDGDIATDVTAGQLLYYTTSLRVLTPVYHECAAIENLAAATDDRDIWMAPFAVTITSVACSCEGTCTDTAELTLEDRGGNAMTHTAPTCSTSGNSTYAAVTLNNGLVAGEKLNFDTGAGISPETDEYLLCWTYTVDRQ